uniref:intron-encoded RNA maturase bI4 n=1 Tax=Fomes fomentarius TaxID=40442 RepID=UPI0030023490
QIWPNIMILIVNIIYTCAISWKYILNSDLVKIYNKTINISDLLIKNLFIKFNLFNYMIINLGFVPKIKNFNINPIIVRYYYKICNQQITKVIKGLNQFMQHIINNRVYLIINIFFNNNKSYPLLQVGISETIRTQKKIINSNNKNFLIPYYIGKRGISTRINNAIIKDNHNNEISLIFKQWFAGITDGDGYIYVNKQGYVGFEITLPTCDEKVLRIIQNKFGGNIKARSGVKAVRYRTKNKESVSKIIQCLNGLIINNIRLVQLHKACLALNIPIKDPITPTIDSAYISGLLDSDGSINIYKHFYNLTYRYQLTISIANKSRSNIEFLLPTIGGNIYFDRSENGRYIWKANSKLLHLKLYDYFLKFPPKTIKTHRTHLIKEFHELNDKKVYRDTDILSMNFKIWKNFISKWDNNN